MTVRVDPQVDAAYIPIGNEPIAGESIQQLAGIHNPHGRGEIILDFDAAGHLIGIEVLAASQLIRAEALEQAEKLDPPEQIQDPPFA